MAWHHTAQSLSCATQTNWHLTQFSGLTFLKWFQTHEISLSFKTNQSKPSPITHYAKFLNKLLLSQSQCSILAHSEPHLMADFMIPSNIPNTLLLYHSWKCYINPQDLLTYTLMPIWLDNTRLHEVNLTAVMYNHTTGCTCIL